MNNKCINCNKNVKDNAALVCKSSCMVSYLDKKYPDRRHTYYKGRGYTWEFKDFTEVARSYYSGVLVVYKGQITELNI